MADDDLEGMGRAALVAEVKRLREGIRAHRDSSGHDLCWYHPRLWGLLPEAAEAEPVVPEWPQFLRGCIRFRESLDTQLADAPRTQEEFGRRCAEPSRRTWRLPVGAWSLSPPAGGRPGACTSIRRAGYRGRCGSG